MLHLLIPRPGAEQLQLLAAGEGFLLLVFSMPLLSAAGFLSSWNLSPLPMCAGEAYRQLT